MEFVTVQGPLLNLPVATWVVVAVAALLVIAGAVFMIVVNTKRYQAREHSTELPTSLGFVVFALGLITLLLVSTYVFHDGPQGRQQENAKLQIQKAYGVSFEYSDFRRLEYPTNKPKADFEVYGSAEITARTGGFSFKKADVYLVWSDGKFGLAKSPDGKRFNQMPLEKESIR